MRTAGRMTDTRTDELDYHLPEEAIAQEPLAERDASRLLVLHRATGLREHRVFACLPEYLGPGDVVVVNDTRVRPARLEGRRATGGRVRVLLLEETGEARWTALLRPLGRLRAGERIVFPGGLAAVFRGRLDAERALLDLEVEGRPALRREVEEAAALPLPPYIRREPRDPTRYQTVYAREAGSVAAPTAGLHFTPALLARLRAAGVTVTAVTLHVGPGTFRPVRSEWLEDHRLDPEYAAVPAAAADAVNAALARGCRVLAVGTTVTRALETAWDEGAGRVVPWRGLTDLFIRPGFRFRVVKALLTNFHQPRTTLLALVAAFAGRQRVMEAYREALALGYRFLSFGDAMLIL